MHSYDFSWDGARVDRFFLHLVITKHYSGAFLAFLYHNKGTFTLYSVGVYVTLLISCLYDSEKIACSVISITSLVQQLLWHLSRKTTISKKFTLCLGDWPYMG